MKRIPAVQWGLSKSPIEMRKLKIEAGTSIIPAGCYCYDEKGKCPYFDSSSKYNEQNDGFCWYLEKGDWMTREEGGTFLLFDQCKECGINDNNDEIYLNNDK